MGKVYTIQLGKLSREDDIYVRRHYNREISVKRKEGFQYTRSKKQGANRKLFGQRSRKVREWLEANSDPPTREYKKEMRRFKRICKDSPGRYKTFRGYLVANLPVRDETMND